MGTPSDRLITIAIHTYDHAISMKSLLERHGIEAVLQNVNLDHPVVSSGMRVRIKESELPEALRIIENPDVFLLPESDSNDANIILVPVDFSDYSEQACKLAFKIAAIHKSNIVLLHSFTDPIYASTLQLSDSLTYDVAGSETRQVFMAEADKKMSEFTTQLHELIKTGELPPVKFRRKVCEGVPEDSINSYAKENKPLLIVMGTRGADKKGREMVGSVTAEVLDTCRYPVFTVPEGMTYNNISNIKRVLYFCNLDQDDMLALERLRQLIPNRNMRVTLANIPSKKQVDASRPLMSLCQYCTNRYAELTFDTELLTLENVDAEFERITQTQHIDLIAVPNKKKSVFARLFNPGIAHRLLFHRDSPMIVIPV